MGLMFSLSALIKLSGTNDLFWQSVVKGAVSINALPWRLEREDFLGSTLAAHDRAVNGADVAGTRRFAGEEQSAVYWSRQGMLIVKAFDGNVSIGAA